MTLTAHARVEAFTEDEAQVLVTRPTGIDLFDVTLVQPDPDGGTALYVRGAGWQWVEQDFELVLSLWQQAKTEGYAFAKRATRNAC